MRWEKVLQQADEPEIGVGDPNGRTINRHVWRNQYCSGLRRRQLRGVFALRKKRQVPCLRLVQRGNATNERLSIPLEFACEYTG